MSIIIPTYNRSNMLIELLTCLSEQSWKRIQIIIVDDGSTDDTDATVADWHRRHPDISLVFLRQNNTGPSSARNKGLLQADGEFVYFIDSDDLVTHDGIRTLVNALKQSDKAYSLGVVQNTSLNRSPIPWSTAGIPRLSSKGDVLWSAWKTHAALYRRCTLRTVGGYVESLWSGDDGNLHWRIVATFGVGQVVTQTVGLRRVHSSGHLGRDAPLSESLGFYIDALASFLQWADRESKFNDSIVRGATKRALVYVVKAGWHEDWANKQKAVDILILLGTNRSTSAQNLARICAPDIRWYFAVPRAALECTKFLVHSINWIHSFRKKTRRV